jgi:uncharacterized protein YukJ
VLAIAGGTLEDTRMPLKHYGVLKGQAMASRAGEGASPHYQVHVVAADTRYRIAVNVKSQLTPSELLYVVVEDFRHPITPGLLGLGFGYHTLPRQPGGISLDFIRGNLFHRSQMKALPHSVPGPDNDLNEKLNAYIQRAIDDEDAVVYAFGERWGPEESTRDRYFGFLPGNGIHDIHMNQGNSGRFVAQDGVWQDGGLVIHYPPLVDPDGVQRFPEQWVGIFLAFQSQAWHTDDRTGHTISTEPIIVGGGEPDGLVRIVAAMVNPPGADPGLERVSIVNTTPDAIDLKGWSIADKNKRKTTLPGPTLAPGAIHQIVLTADGAQLSNDGGIITLLDAKGIKVHGVSYTKPDAAKQGWTIVF